MKKLLVFLVAISIQLCCFSPAFSVSFEETKHAAEQGDPAAQFSLGVMYANGQGVRQNLATAKEWYGRACDNGNQDGCDAYARLNR